MRNLLFKIYLVLEQIRLSVEDDAFSHLRDSLSPSLAYTLDFVRSNMYSWVLNFFKKCGKEATCG